MRSELADALARIVVAPASEPRRRECLRALGAAGFRRSAVLVMRADCARATIREKGVERSIAFSGDASAVVHYGRVFVGRRGDLRAPLGEVVGRWYVVAPLGKEDGAMTVAYADGHPEAHPSRAVLSSVRMLATTARAAAASGSRYRGVVEEARRDPLTGLPNRRAIVEELRRANAHGGRLVVAIIDVDDFKAINDRGGHQSGDRVLREVAAVLAAVARDGEVVGRFAGDEFAVIVPAGTPSAARHAIRRFSSALRRTGLSCSIGAALAPENGRSGSALLHAADLALYRVKAAGKNGFAFAPLRRGGTRLADVANDQPTLADLPPNHQIASLGIAALALDL